jgi:hypothetical protein
VRGVRTAHRYLVIDLHRSAVLADPSVGQQQQQEQEQQEQQPAQGLEEDVVGRFHAKFAAGELQPLSSLPLVAPSGTGPAAAEALRAARQQELGLGSAWLATPVGGERATVWPLFGADFRGTGVDWAAAGLGSAQVVVVAFVLPWCVSTPPPPPPPASPTTHARQETHGQTTRHFSACCRDCPQWPPPPPPPPCAQVCVLDAARAAAGGARAGGECSPCPTPFLDGAPRPACSSFACSSLQATSLLACPPAAGARRSPSQPAISSVWGRGAVPLTPQVSRAGVPVGVRVFHHTATNPIPAELFGERRSLGSLDATCPEVTCYTTYSRSGVPVSPLLMLLPPTVCQSWRSRWTRCRSWFCSTHLQTQQCQSLRPRPTRVLLRCGMYTATNHVAQPARSRLLPR